jgi:hypothetical protein
MLHIELSYCVFGAFGYGLALIFNSLRIGTTAIGCFYVVQIELAGPNCEQSAPLPETQVASLA